MRNPGKRLLSRSSWAIDGVTEISGYLCGLAVLAASLIITFGVIVRKMGVSTSWETELATYLLILAVFVGAAYTQKHDGHISIDLVSVYIPPKTRGVIEIIGSFLGLVVAVVVSYLSWPIWWDAIKYNEHSESLWGPHLAFPYILIPIGSTLLAFQYIVYLNKKIRAFRSIHTVTLKKSEETGRVAPEGEVAG